MSDRAAACVEAFEGLQDDICHQLERLDGRGRFREDRWERPGGGGGRSRVIEGTLIEKGGVNFSAVHGTLSEAAGRSLGTGAGDFLATGVSIVLHPHNPHVPIIHMNVRFFELQSERGGARWWFGGGIDLTPHYVDAAAAGRFHRGLRAVCLRHPAVADYAAFKRQADDYFYIRHRRETRGIGGIFYDRLVEPSFDETFGFTREVGAAFVPLYAEQCAPTRDREYGEVELAWQRLRRGRYVEFNLVWDRGTRFGLETDGRTESILMSMPPRADWVYDYQLGDDSRESHTIELLRKGVDWIGEDATASDRTVG